MTNANHPNLDHVFDVTYGYCDHHGRAAFVCTKCQERAKAAPELAPMTTGDALDQQLWKTGTLKRLGYTIVTITENDDLYMALTSTGDTMYLSASDPMEYTPAPAAGVAETPGLAAENARLRDELTAANREIDRLRKLFNVT